MMGCFPTPEAQVEKKRKEKKKKNRHFSAVTLEVTKLTLSKRVVEGLCEVPKPLLVSPNHHPTMNELMASFQRRY
jgi:hypothetical protein